jgi:hypothetical protein
MKRLILALLLSAVCSRAIASPDPDNWYCVTAWGTMPAVLRGEVQLEQGTNLILNPGCGFTLDALGYDGQVSCADQVTRCYNQTYSPEMRQRIWDQYGQTMEQYLETNSFDPTRTPRNMWTCQDIETEAKSRLYWIDTWKKERARGQTLEAQIRALKAKCGRRCR